MRIQRVKTDYSDRILCDGYYVCSPTDDLDRILFHYVNVIGTSNHIYLGLKYYDHIKIFISQMDSISL